jgi:heme-degrading monooxygenase HmoA
MSVIMTMWMRADRAKFEETASQHADEMRAIGDRAKEHGAIAHRFYANEDGGQIMVIDEWPDQESFERFFASIQDEIRPMMEEAGVQGEPGINFWRVLDTSDKFLGRLAPHEALVVRLELDPCIGEDPRDQRPLARRVGLTPFGRRMPTFPRLVFGA